MKQVYLAKVVRDDQSSMPSQTIVAFESSDERERFLDMIARDRSMVGGFGAAPLIMASAEEAIEHLRAHFSKGGIL